MQTEISIIVPFLNEGENIPHLVSSISDFFGSSDKPKVQVIFVDDGSTDDSVEQLKKANHKNYSAKLIRFSQNYGSHAALRSGILNADSEYITFMYADLQDPLAVIPQMYEKALAGNDIVWAQRKTTKAGTFEKMFSSQYAKLMRKYVTKTFPERGFDIVMFNSKISRELNDNVEKNSSIFLQILTLGYKQDYVLYDKQERQKGKSKWTLSKKIKLLVDSFVAFSFAPIRFVTMVGIFLFIMGFVWSLYVILRSIIFHDLSPGWPTLIAVLMFGFGITNISLGIIAEYLWRTLDASRGRKAFIVDEIIDLNTK